MNSWENDKIGQEINNAASRISGQIAAESRANRKHLLRIEIAKAEDRRVKAELTEMLNEIERKEKRDRIVGFILLVVIIVAGFLGFQYFKNSNNHAEMAVVDTTQKKSAEETQQTTVSETTSSLETNSSVKGTNSTRETIDTKNLTVDQIKQWVSAIIDARGSKNHYSVDVSTKEGYAYATVNNTDAQVDTMGIYRVNEKGELEEDGYYCGKPGTWVVVSNEFMNTLNIPEYPSPQSSSSINIALAKVWLLLRPQANESQLTATKVLSGSSVIENSAVVYPEDVYQIWGEGTGATNQLVVSINGDSIINYPVNIYWWSDKTKLDSQEKEELANRIITEKRSFDISNIDEAQAQTLASKIVVH